MTTCQDDAPQHQDSQNSASSYDPSDQHDRSRGNYDEVFSEPKAASSRSSHLQVPKCPFHNSVLSRQSSTTTPIDISNSPDDGNKDEDVEGKTRDEPNIEPCVCECPQHRLVRHPSFDNLEMGPAEEQFVKDTNNAEWKWSQAYQVWYDGDDEEDAGSWYPPEWM